MTGLSNAFPNASGNSGDQRLETWLLLVCAVIVIAAGIGLRDPWPSDEPRFAMVAKQMVESGDWLIPQRGRELYADKPPMFMALQAAAYSLTGNWRLAFLLPSLLSCLGILLLVYDLARRLWGHRVGLYAAGALLATFQFVYQAKRAQIDPLATFFVTLANYGLLRHFLLGPAWRWYWWGCFAAALGAITKGVGILSLLMFVPYLFARLRRWEYLAPIENSGWRWLAGAACFMAGLSVWLVPMLIRVHVVGTSEYLAYPHEILFHQTAGRYSDSWDHGQPVWFYLGVVVVSWLPLSLTYPGSLRHWHARLVARDARILMPLAWAVLVIFFFSFSSGKRDVYILPALPWVAFASAPFLQDVLQRAWLNRAAFILVSVVGMVFLAAGLFALLGHPDVAQSYVAQRGLGDRSAALWWLCVAIGAACLAPAAFFRSHRGVLALLCGLAGMWLLWSLAAYPILNDSLSAAGVMRRASHLMAPEDELGMVAWREQHVLLADRAVAEFGFLEPWSTQLSKAIVWQQAAPESRWIFILDEAMGECVDPAKATYLGVANQSKWWLFRAEAVEPQCRNGLVPETEKKTPGTVLSRD